MFWLGFAAEAGNQWTALVIVQDYCADVGLQGGEGPVAYPGPLGIGSLLCTYSFHYCESWHVAEAVTPF